jgi:NAD(P)-dependent dehydrogenase (short-subunit alcohol dehydrogenase family)
MQRAEPVAVVTGAGSGIGQAIALRLAELGQVVVGVDMAWPDPPNGSETADLTHSIHRRTCDVANREQVDHLFQFVDTEFGRLDVLVNSAGVDVVCPLVDVTDADWDRVLAVNLLGTFLCMRAGARRMQARHGGRIINIASNRGLEGLALGAPYAASKGGVIALTKSAAVELAADGIGVYALLPGATLTKMRRSTAGKANPPSYVAAAVAPLLAADALALSGAAISIPRKP